MHLTSCGTLVILIRSTSEFLLYFIGSSFFLFHFTVKKKEKEKEKKRVAAGLFLCCFCVALFLLQEYLVG